MFEILKSPDATFKRIRSEQNQKIENYIKRLDKFWTLLKSLSDKEFLEEGSLKFKPTYIDKQKLIEAGFTEKTIGRYIQIFEHDGYLTREYNTYDNGNRKIGYSLFITLHPEPIIPSLNKIKRQQAFLEEMANSKTALVLNNLKMANA